MPLASHIVLATTKVQLPVAAAPMLYAVGGFSAANYFATAMGGGESGIATGFGFAVMCRLNPVSTASGRTFFDHFFSPLEGWYCRTNSYNGQVQITFVSGAASLVHATTTILTSDLGRVLVIIGQHTGSDNKVRSSVFRAAFVSTAITGYTPSARQVGLGKAVNINSGPADGVDVFAALTFRGVPTDTQLTELVDIARAKFDLPTPAEWPYGITHRWSAGELLYGSGIVDGDIAPAALPDTVTGVALDEMARVGSPVVRVIDPAIDGRETYGVLGFSQSSYLIASTSGIKGSAGGMTLAVRMVIDALPGTARNILTNLEPSPASGYQLVIVNATTLRFDIFNSGGGYISLLPPITFSTAHIGASILVVYTFDGSNWKAFRDGVLQGTPYSSSYKPGVSAMRVGMRSDVTQPATDLRVFEVAGSDTQALTDAEVAELNAATTRDGRIPSHAKFNHLYDFTSDIAANGGPTAGVPAQMLDRVGVDHLTRVGTGLQVAQRTERLWSYESTPILQGAGNFGTVTYYATAVGKLPGEASGFAVAWLGTISAQLNGRILIAARGSATTGWSLSTTSTAAVFNLGNASVSASSPTSPISSGDFGRLMLYVGVWDATAAKARLYARRAEVGAGTALASYAPLASVQCRIGRSETQTNGSDFIVYGAAYMLGIPSLAQVQAYFDLVMATERMQLIPGMSGSLYNVTEDVIAAGGAVPATVRDRGTGGSNFTRTGSPTLGQQYARAWGW